MFITMRDEHNNFRFLPKSGGIFEQDFLWMEIFNIIAPLLVQPVELYAKPIKQLLKTKKLLLEKYLYQNLLL